MNHAVIKNKWIFAHGLNTEQEIRQNSQLTYHASKIIELFDKVIENIISINKSEFNDIIKLGRNHYGYGVRAQDFIVT
jgi:hypothetical protein